MAIWQVPFHLKHKDNNVLSFTPSFIESLHELSRTFMKEDSWSKAIEQYGSIDSTCIEIGFSENRVIEDISVRIDLRTVTRHDLQTICSFANQNALIVEYNDKEFDPKIDNFIDIFQTTNAFKFVKNPQDYFKQLSELNDKTKG